MTSVSYTSEPPCLDEAVILYTKQVAVVLQQMQGCAIAIRHVPYGAI